MNATYQILTVDRCYVVEFPKETTGQLTAQAQHNLNGRPELFAVSIPIPALTANSQEIRRQLAVKLLRESIEGRR